jgi:hypothetical protein
MDAEFSHYPFVEGSVFRFDMSEFLHLDNVKLFIGDETGGPGVSEESFPNIGRAFSYSMKSKRECAPPNFLLSLPSAPRWLVHCSFAATTVSPLGMNFKCEQARDGTRCF